MFFECSVCHKVKRLWEARSFTDWNGNPRLSNVCQACCPAEALDFEEYEEYEEAE